jgi:hypothetical protein
MSGMSHALIPSMKALTVQIATKAWTKFGTRHEGEIRQGHFATIVPGVSITLHGTVTQDHEKVQAKLWERVRLQDATGRFLPDTYRCVAHAECRGGEDDGTIREAECGTVRGGPASKEELEAAARKIGERCAREHAGKPMPYSRTFVIGDIVEFDSYNLSYTGPIVGISAKTVKVDMERGVDAKGRPRCKHMNLAEFDSRNWDLDLDAIARRNQNFRD